MAPKKKAAADPEPPVESKAPLIAADDDKWVILDFKLLNWKYMNFNMKFRDTTHVFSIKKILRERLGKMNDLKICFHSFTEANEVTNDMLTLEACGIKGKKLEYNVGADGKVDEEEIPVVTVYYDYKPSDFEDPVLLYFKG